MLNPRYSCSLTGRGVAALLIACAVLGITSHAAAQTPSLDAFYRKLEPKESFKYKWKGESKLCNVGMFRWEVPQSTFSTGGLDRNFTGYCAEIDVPMFDGKTYRFQQQNIRTPTAFRLPATPEGAKAVDKRVTLI